MALIDLKPLGDVEKYLQLTVVAFVSFFSTFGSVGASTLAAGWNVPLALATALCSACMVMSTAVWATAKQSGLFTKIKPDMPSGLKNIVESTDVQPGVSPEDVKRRYME